MNIKNLEVPNHAIDVALDTDAFNEIDDQFAIGYLLRSTPKLNTVAIYAAPFSNAKAATPAEGMLKSYDEILKVISLCNREDLKPSVFKGSDLYLPDESTPVMSAAASDLANRAMGYSVDNPLYVVAIGAITNVASAILLAPEIAERIVVVWLGGHTFDYPHTREFNLKQDVAAARVVMNSGAPFVQLPCRGVVSELRTTKPELEHWLLNKNELADYLARNAIREAESYASGKPWSRVIWDVAAVAWLMNDDDRFMKTKICDLRLPNYDGKYDPPSAGKQICYVYSIDRDTTFEDLFNKLIK